MGTFRPTVDRQVDESIAKILVNDLNYDEERISLASFGDKFELLFDHYWRPDHNSPSGTTVLRDMNVEGSITPVVRYQVDERLEKLLVEDFDVQKSRARMAGFNGKAKMLIDLYTGDFQEVESPGD
jgi:hypothetical protein